MKEILSWLNEFLYSNILIILLVVAGMYFTLKTRFVQIRMLKEGISLLKEKAHSEDG
ncbi:MAG: amino acid carrier protein, partial [Coprobacillus cateniformis]